jgi:hypothetical protein
MLHFRVCLCVLCFCFESDVIPCAAPLSSPCFSDIVYALSFVKNVTCIATMDFGKSALWCDPIVGLSYGDSD